MAKHLSFLAILAVPAVAVPPPAMADASADLHAPGIMPSSFASRPAISTFNASLDAPRAMWLASDEGFADSDRDRLSSGRAAALSILLPGAGQWYAGARGRAGVFLGTEAAAWAGFAYFRIVAGNKEEDFREYALVHAGADLRGKDDEFFRTLTFYDSRFEYNEEGRLLGADRPFYPDLAEWDWQWDSESARHRYRAFRNQGKEAEQRAKFALGAALLNRLVAAVDAWRTARSVNRRERMENAHWNVRLKGHARPHNPGLAVVFSRRF